MARLINTSPAAILSWAEEDLGSGKMNSEKDYQHLSASYFTQNFIFVL